MIMRRIFAIRHRIENEAFRQAKIAAPKTTPIDNPGQSGFVETWLGA